ncbi:MAG TPA: response regulator transcription factor [Saprospiraceae bacterium]|nr:response regulator transcription factor [Saprospiraceae bacterium]HMQ82138.1 response regulator transcription factor [Saprospiraceae bacterium]
MRGLHILIVEEQPITASGIRQAVLSSSLPAPEATHFLRLQELWESTFAIHNPLIIIGPSTPMDIKHLPLVKKKFPKAGIIAIQPKITCSKAKKLFKAKIDALLCAQAPLEELTQAIQKVINGGKFTCSFVQKMLLDISIGIQSQMSVLTDREKEVLQLIVNEFTTKEIAEKLYISSCTAETHRLNIIHKLGVRNTAGIVREALRMDLC